MDGFIVLDECIIKLIFSVLRFCFVLFCLPHKRVPEKVTTDEENRARPFRTNRRNPCRAPRFSVPPVAGDYRPAWQVLNNVCAYYRGSSVICKNHSQRLRVLSFALP
jgi:hypothetical protein